MKWSTNYSLNLFSEFPPLNTQQIYSPNLLTKFTHQITHQISSKFKSISWICCMGRICCVNELFALSTVSPPPFKSVDCICCMDPHHHSSQLAVFAVWLQSSMGELCVPPQFKSIGICCICHVGYLFTPHHHSSKLAVFCCMASICCMGFHHQSSKLSTFCLMKSICLGSPFCTDE